MGRRRGLGWSGLPCGGRIGSSGATPEEHRIRPRALLFLRSLGGRGGCRFGRTRSRGRTCPLRRPPLGVTREVFSQPHLRDAKEPGIGPRFLGLRRRRRRGLGSLRGRPQPFLEGGETFQSVRHHHGDAIHLADLPNPGLVVGIRFPGPLQQRVTAFPGGSQEEMDQDRSPGLMECLMTDRGGSGQSLSDLIKGAEFFAGHGGAHLASRFGGVKTTRVAKREPFRVGIIK